MKKFTIFQAPYLAFYSAEFYRDVYTRWKGTGFGYLLMLLMACWVLMSVTIQGGINEYVSDYLPSVLNQIPVVAFKDGEASTPENRPYLIQDKESEVLFAVIDVSGQYNSLDDTEAKILVEKDKLTYEESAFETRTYNFKEIKDFTLDREVIDKWVEIVRKWLVSFIYPFCVIGLYLYRIVQVLIYASIGMLFASWAKAKGDYVSYLRVAVMAITPCVLIGTLLMSFSIALPGSGLIFMMMALGYMFFATRAVFSNSEPPTTLNDIDYGG